MPVDIGEGVTLITRAEWGARSPKGLTPNLRSNIVRNLLHYSAGKVGIGDDRASQVRAVQNFHMDGRGYSDIAYNLIGDPFSKTVYEGRPLDAQGAHCTGQNKVSWSYCILGVDTPNAQDYSEDGLTAVVQGFRYLNKARGLDLPIKGHKDYFPTACPGDEFYALLPTIRARLAGGGVPSPVSPPPPAPSPVGPPWPGRYIKLTRPYMTGVDVRTWQSRMKVRGWNITLDGVYGRQSADICRQFQADKSIGVDGVVGPVTWMAAWTAPIT